MKYSERWTSYSNQDFLKNTKRKLGYKLQFKLSEQAHHLLVNQVQVNLCLYEIRLIISANVCGRLELHCHPIKIQYLKNDKRPLSLHEDRPLNYIEKGKTGPWCSRTKHIQLPNRMAHGNKSDRLLQLSNKYYTIKGDIEKTNKY